MAKSQTTHTLNLSEERYAIALSWILANHHQLDALDDDARMMAALGLLICDENGCITEAELASALADPRAISAANLLINGSVN